MDKAWWDIYLEEVEKVFAGVRINPWRARNSKIDYVQFDHMRNSGAGAISLAALLGAKRIIMLGYDCQKTDGKTHWHGDHPESLGNAGSVAQWPAFFSKLSTKLKHISVVNASRQTKLDMFQRVNLEDALLETEPKPSFYVEGMHGLGDNIYSRAFIKALPGDVYLSTPWPQLFSDLPNVKPVACNSRLRTQAKNLKRQESTEFSPPHNAKHLKIQYTAQDFASGGLLNGMQRCFGVDPAAFDLPEFPCPISVDKPIALIRPVTIRNEWKNTARNPNPEYIEWVAEQLKYTHHVVSVADIEAGKEWIEGDEPFAHQKFHKGELGLVDLLGLVRHADIICGGVGWIVPASIAYGKRLFCVLGGHGGHNAPEKITHPSMDLSRMHFATPDNFCKCTSMQHSCIKKISNLEQQWAQFLNK